MSFTRAQWSRVREVDRTLKVVCYKGGDETRELELEDRKKNKYHLPDSQTGGHEARSNKRLMLL